MDNYELKVFYCDQKIADLISVFITHYNSILHLD